MLLFLDTVAGNRLHEAAHGLDHQRIARGQHHAGDDHAVVEHHARALEAVRDVVGRLRDVQHEGLERLLLGVGREVRAEVDAFAVELMASLTDGRNGLAAGGITLERGDDLNGGERLGASRFRRQVGADELGGRSVAPMGLHDGVDVEGLPEASLAITDPPFGEVGLSELLVQRKLDHRAGGFGAAREGQRGEVALELDLVQFTGKQASADITDGGSRVQAPGQPGISRRPFERGLGHDLGDGGMDFGLAVCGTEADGLEVSAILSVELLGDRHKRGDGGRGLEITQRDRDLATHGGGLVLGHGFAEREDVAIGGAEGAEGHEASGIVRGSELLAGECGALITQLREQPDGPG